MKHIKTFEKRLSHWNPWYWILWISLHLHRVSEFQMLADIMEQCRYYGWRIEMIPKTYLVDNHKWLIRIDDQDFEYQAMLYGWEYEPIALVDGYTFYDVVYRTHEITVTPELWHNRERKAK